MKPTNLGSFHLKSMVSAVDPHEKCAFAKKGIQKSGTLAIAPYTNTKVAWRVTNIAMPSQ